MAVTVTVGRNVGSGLDSKPMDTRTWELFRDEVFSVVSLTVGDPFFAGVGKGWSEDWGVEDAYTVIAPEPQYSDIREKLHVALSKLGRYYGQEAVAVTEGTTQFV